MNNLDLLERDLATFADLGTGPPHRVSSSDSHLALRMFRGGEEIELVLHDGGSGKVVERSLSDQSKRTHASFRALLASERFGNLRHWAESQRIVLQGVLSEGQPRLPVWGNISEGDHEVGPEELDETLQENLVKPGTLSVLLIDGPAGIGKTRFIEILAYRRAKAYLTLQRPLLLHVESRGRVLTFIQDLLAFSLQRMRLSVTFDQVPVLARHGLITLAIDGFDELGDPSGYEHAWGQLGDLLDQVRGGGTVILAGRDTFIGRERIVLDVKALTRDDVVRALTLRPTRPEDAKTWLTEHGWQQHHIDSVAELLEPGSYALRPFFLAQLTDPDFAETIRDESVGAPLALLVDAMIRRETSKFGDAVDEVMDIGQRETFVRRFLQEVARFMADDQVEAIDELALTWIVDIAAPDGTGTETLNVLKNRSAVMAFLAKDDADNHRRFAHSQLFNHFLSEETLDTISQKEIPKFVRRNILAADFLGAFSDLSMHVVHQAEAERASTFFHAAAELVKTYSSMDRGTRNLGALLVTALPAMAYTGGTLRLEDMYVDEAVLKECTLPLVVLERVVINQLDVRGADVRDVAFKDSMVLTLIADEATRFGQSFVVPALIRYEAAGQEDTISDKRALADWIDSKTEAASGGGLREGALGGQVDRELLKLLERTCRHRSYWIRQDDSDPVSARLVTDVHWGTLVALFRKHDLCREATKAAGGHKAVFLHIKRPMDILKRIPGDEQIGQFYESLKQALQA